MDRLGIDRLTGGERNALSSYHEHGGRKAAALALGKSEATIAAQLASARRKLGAVNSAAAARAYVRSIEYHPNQTNPPRIMAAGGDPVDGSGAFQPVPDGRCDQVREVRTPFEGAPLDRPPVPALPETRHDLSPLSSQAQMIVIAVGLIILIVAVPGLLDLFKSFAVWVRRFYP